MKNQIPNEWYGIATKMETERKFRVEITDLGFSKYGNDFCINPDESHIVLWNFTHKLMPKLNFAITLNKQTEMVLSYHKDWDIFNSVLPIPYNDFIFWLKGLLRKTLTEALESLDKTTYTPQSIFDNIK